MSHTAFVTGASGFVGAHLVRELLAGGWQVTALVRSTSPLEELEGLDADLREGDITDRASLDAALPRGVDGVFHVAASTNIWSGHNDIQRLINVDGTRNVLEAAITAGARRLVHTSSFVVYGFQERVISEDSPWVKEGSWINYLETKREAEMLVKDAAAQGRLDATICNPAHILGPGDRHNWSRMIAMVDRGKLPGIPPGGGAFADVREVAKAHVAAFHQGRTGENYLLGGPETAFLDVVRMTGEILGKKVPAKPSPAWLLKTAGRIYALLALITRKAPDVTPEGAAMISRHIHCDSSRAVSELGYGFTPVRELLEDTCAWMRDRGMLE